MCLPYGLRNSIEQKTNQTKNPTKPKQTKTPPDILLEFSLTLVRNLSFLKDQVLGPITNSPFIQEYHRAPTEVSYKKGCENTPILLPYHIYRQT